VKTTAQYKPDAPGDGPVAYLLDLDGTLYAGGAAIPGAPAVLDRLRAGRVPFRLVTNTTTRSRAMLVDRLRGYGFAAEPEEIFTATLAGAALAREAGHRVVAPFLPPAALGDLAGLELSGGTAGACIGHVSPEAAEGGPIGLLRNGDRLRIDFPNRRMDILVDEAELALRKQGWQPVKRDLNGWLARYQKLVSNASQGGTLSA
jgi:hypothetical protein